MTSKQRICSRCIMDTTVPGIQFDEQGVCNFCKIHDEMEKEFPLNELGQRKLEQLLSKIKAQGKNRKYDCIIGISGGTDSTYCLYMAKKFGLRPLAVHLDNRWDSEIAKNNMEKAVVKLNIDLKTVKCDWEEFKNLQISFLKASVPDVERPTDIGIISVLYRVAAEKNVRYIINGANFKTEGKIPVAWGYGDGRYIKSVYKKFAKAKLKNFPNLTIFDLFCFIVLKRIKMVRLLQYLDYRKEDVKNLLGKEVGWQDYSGHHYESIYTRFVTSYLRPKKFNIDLRKTTYSALIRSGQMIRDEALAKIKEEPYPEDKVREDKKYVIKKLGLTNEEFEKILSRKPKTFRDYPSYYSIFKILRVPMRIAHRFGLLPASFYEMHPGKRQSKVNARDR